MASAPPPSEAAPSDAKATVTTGAVEVSAPPPISSPTPGSPSRRGSLPSRGAPPSPLRSASAAAAAALYAVTEMVDGADGYAASNIFSSASRMAYTWDDLLLLPGEGAPVDHRLSLGQHARVAWYVWRAPCLILPPSGFIDFGTEEVSLGSRITRRITLNTPLVSSPMDTVTEHRCVLNMWRVVAWDVESDPALCIPPSLAGWPLQVSVQQRVLLRRTIRARALWIALGAPVAVALNGGIGIIHYNNTVEEQVNEVSIVKKFENGFINQPMCISPTTTIGEVQLMKERNGFGGYPVTTDGKLGSRLLGIVTDRDYDFREDPDTPISEIMTTEVVVGIQGISLKEVRAGPRRHAPRA